MIPHTEYHPIDFRCFNLLTDDTGMIQHGLFGVPNRATGYTTDDNARALLVAVQRYERAPGPDALRSVALYLAFLLHALTPEGTFHNLMSYDRRWLDERCSEDCHGRALAAAGITAAADLPEGIRGTARQVFAAAMPLAARLRSPRAIAFSLLGISAYLGAEPGALPALGLLTQLADKLAAAYERHRARDWQWFEDSLTYSNAVLPYALLAAYSVTGEGRYRGIGQASLAFLEDVTVVDGVLQPVGCHGWYVRGGTRAWHDQQPVDVAAMVLCCLAAWRVLEEAHYRDLATLSFDWFFGHNALNQPMVSPITGGCQDGLGLHEVNANLGAESQVCYLLAHLAMAREGLAPIRVAPMRAWPGGQLVPAHASSGGGMP